MCCYEYAGLSMYWVYFKAPKARRDMNQENIITMKNWLNYRALPGGKDSIYVRLVVSVYPTNAVNPSSNPDDTYAISIEKTKLEEKRGQSWPILKKDSS